jgi:hypothetical protein
MASRHGLDPSEARKDCWTPECHETAYAKRKNDRSGRSRMAHPKALMTCGPYGWTPTSPNVTCDRVRRAGSRTALEDARGYAPPVSGALYFPTFQNPRPSSLPRLNRSPVLRIFSQDRGEVVAFGLVHGWMSGLDGS